MGRWEDVDEGYVFMLSVDGTHCPINEPFPFSKGWSSYKLGGNAGVNYELGIKINRPQLVWVRGPTQPGKENDIMVFRQALMHAIPANTRAIGDAGYAGEPDKISISSELDPIALAEFKRRVKSRHESFNQRLKCYKCLTTKFRHGVENHANAFRAVCAITQYQLDNGSTSLMNPYPEDFLTWQM